MKVYAAMIALAYEGFEFPLGVFSTKRDALKCCRKAGKRYKWCYDLTVVEYEVDGEMGKTFVLKSY